MDDLISRKALSKILTDKWIDAEWDISLADVLDIIKQLPTVAIPSATGHWEKTPKAVMGEGYMWYCDKCGHEVYQDSSRDYPSENFCPNCGADMRGEQDG